MKKLTVVIPAYNEARYIGALLSRIALVPIESAGFQREVIVVDDGSTDDTARIVKDFPQVTLIQQANQGKGAAVQRGIKEATGDVVLVQDADLEYDPNDYLVLLQGLRANERVAAYGSRPLGVIRANGWRLPFPGKHPDQGLGPWGMNLILGVLTFALCGTWISDNLTGYKLYPLAELRRLRIRTKGFETDHELTIKLLRRGVRIVEVPIRYAPRSTAEGKKIRASDAPKAVWTMIRFRWGANGDFT
jgi:glycosyltransferase involved in cell wall biosynthesis